jgi:8-oxo-dGTP pyrophosphatase MutT (NUDIX family)
MTGPARVRAPRGRSPVTVAPYLAKGSTRDPPISEAGAAVTIVLRPAARDVELLLIERSQNPDDPASGQVALPGGQVSAEDRSLRDTALRELEEEVGLSKSDLRGLPRFVRTDLARKFGLEVAIFAAEHAPTGRTPTVRSPAEVASVFWLPRKEVNRTRTVAVATGSGKVEVSATVFEGHVLWGFTRRVVREFFGFSDGDRS